MEEMRLLDGYYHVHDSFLAYWRVSGDEIECRDAHNTYKLKTTLQYGDFGDASSNVQDKLGKCKYNMKLNFEFDSGEKNENGEAKSMEFEDFGVIVEEGNKVYLDGMVPYHVEKISDEQYEALENDFDDIEAPPCPYKLQPENQGKIVWISGVQGMGKSTSAQILARDHGYVYYEADCFSLLKNPFNDVHADEPSKNIVKLKSLKGNGAEDRVKLVQKAETVFGPMMSGQEYDKSVLNEFYAELSKDILQQKNRIGGDWAIALVVFKRECRDAIREILGPNLTFVHLTMDKEERSERLAQRHEGNEKFKETLEAFEKILDITDETEEPNLIQVSVKKGMTRNEVVEIILNNI